MKNDNIELYIRGDLNTYYSRGHAIHFGATFQMALKIQDTVKLYVVHGIILSEPEQHNRIFTGKYLRKL